MNWPTSLTKLSPLSFLKRFSPIRKFVVREESMLPSLRPGDMVLTWKWLHVGVGDVVVASIGHRLLLKRVSRRNGDRIFLLGDNPEHSQDSRQWGWIERSQIIGRVFFIKKSGEGE